MKGVITTVIDTAAIEKEISQVKSELSSLLKSIEDMTNNISSAYDKMKKSSSLTELSKASNELSTATNKANDAITEREKLENRLNKAEMDRLVAERDIKKAIEDSNGTLDQNIIRQARLTKEIETLKNQAKELSKSFKDGKISQSEYGQGMAEISRQQLEAKSALSELNVNIKQQVKEVNAADGSITQMGVSLGQMKKAYRDLTDEQRNSPVGQGLLKDIQQLDKNVKEADASIGNHQRNVGNYEGAIVSLRTQIRVLVEQMAALRLAGKENTVEYQNIAKRAGELQDVYSDVRKQTRALASDTKNLDGVLRSMQSLQAAFMAIQSIDGFAEKGSTLASIMDKLKIAIAGVSAAVVIQNTLQKQSAVMQGILSIQTAAATKAQALQTSTTLAGVAAQRVFNAVAKANPYVLLATGIMAVVGALVAFTSKSKEAANEKKTLNEVNQKGAEIAKTEGAELSKLVATASAYAHGTKERAAAIKSINENYGNYLTNLLTEKSSAEDLKRAYEELQPVLVQQAIVRASLEKIGEKGGLLTDNLLKQKNIQQQMADIEAKMAKERQEHGDELSKQTQGFMGGVDTQFTALGNLSNEYKLLGGDLSDLQTEYAKTEEEMALINSVSADAASQLAKSYSGVADAAKQSSEMQTEQKKIEKKAIDDLTESVENYTKEVEKALDLPDNGNTSFFMATRAELDKVKTNVEDTIHGIEVIGDASQRSIEEASSALADQYNKGEISAQQYQDRLKEIQDGGNRAALEAQLAYVEKQMQLNNLPFEAQITLEQKLAELKRQLRAEDVSDAEKSADKQLESTKKMYAGIMDVAQQAFNMAMDFLIQQQEARIADIDAQIEEVDAWKERELERLDESVMSEETRAAETKRINEQAETDRKKLEEEKRKEQQKMAVYQKAQSIVQTIINTAQAVSAALTIPVAGIALAAVVAAMGAAQVAIIAAQPLPKYRFGTDDHPGGPAVMGDGGKREYALTPTGKILETASTPTLYDIPAHTKVFPDYASLMDYFRPEIPNYTSTATQAPDFSEGIERIEQAVAKISHKQEVHVNLDNNGIWWVTQNGTRRSRMICSKVNRKL